MPLPGIPRLRALAFLVLFSILSPGLWAAQPAGRVTALEGHADVTRGHAPARPLALHDPLFTGDVLRTKSASRLEVELRDGSRLTLDENTRLVLDRYLTGDAPEGIFEVIRGRVRSLVGDLFSRRRESFRLRTPTSILGVQGTDFLTAADARETRVEVYAGRVAVRNRDPAIPGTLVLGPGDSALIRAGEPPVRTTPGHTSRPGSGGVLDLRSGGIQGEDPARLTPGRVPASTAPPSLHPPRP